MKSRIGTVIFICGCPGLVHASGNVLPRANSESLGMADANVALASGPAAQFINPANIVQPLLAPWPSPAGEPTPTPETPNE